MAGKYSTIGANGIFVLVCLAVVQLCSAQTVHVVGGSTGWSFPSSSSFYSTWAASQTFRVGDVLEFNFTTGFHSVATVTKSAYDTCNVTSPLALSTTGPVNITIKSGTQYFFCTYPGHCDAGQKFTVTASASSPAPVVAPAPSPRATAPSPSPRIHAPAPSPRAQTVHVVGGSTGWSFPSSSSFYSTWAASQTFRVGDVLEFNFTTGFHSVATVTKSAYDTCNVTSTLALSTTGPVNITIKSGTQYFFCTYPGHCDAGQKFTVTASASSPSPVVVSAPSPGAHAPAPSTRTTAPAPATVSKSPKKAPAASPSSNPAVSPTPSSTPVSTPSPPTVASSPAEGPGGASPSTTTPSSSTPPATAAGVLVSLVSVAVALLY